MLTLKVLRLFCIHLFFFKCDHFDCDILVMRLYWFFNPNVSCLLYISIYAIFYNTFLYPFVACDTSCATCHPDNPSCMSCPPEHALHQGKCVPQCPPQSYKNDHGRCQGEKFSFTLLIFCSTRPCRFTGKHKLINLFSSELKNHSF